MGPELEHVATWLWGPAPRPDRSYVEMTVATTIDVLDILAEHGLSTPDVDARIIVSRYGDPDDTLYDTTIPLRAGQDADRVVGQLPPIDPAVRLGSVDTYVVCAPESLTANGIARQPGALRFHVSGHPYLDTPSLTASLRVFSDVWLPFDADGRPQPEVHRRNAPVLTEVLNEIAALLGEETEPDRPTYFGTPTPTGIAGPFHGEN